MRVFFFLFSVSFFGLYFLGFSFWFGREGVECVLGWERVRLSSRDSFGRGARVRPSASANIFWMHALMRSSHFFRAFGGEQRI